MIRVAAWVAAGVLGFASLGAAAYFGRQSGEEARDRVKQLEGQLERQTLRLRDVEKKIQSFERTAKEVAGSRLAGWNRLKVGMTREDVRQLLGPETSIRGSATMQWIYEYPNEKKRGAVEFDSRWTVVAWVAP